MRSLLIIILLAAGFSLAASAQTAIQRDTTCNFLKDIKFKNGIATITVNGYYDDYHRSGDEPYLMMLSRKKKLRYSDYGTSDAGCSGISFIPIGCSKRVDGAINRKVKFDPDQIKEGDILRITCLVFEDKSVRNKRGRYFFVITGVSRKNPAK